MSERRRGLGRGLGALIPSAPGSEATRRPVDVFFPEQEKEKGTETPEPEGASTGQSATTTAERTPVVRTSVLTQHERGQRTGREAGEESAPEAGPDAGPAAAPGVSRNGDAEGRDGSDGLGEPVATDLPALTDRADAGSAPDANATDGPAPAGQDGDLVSVPGASFGEVPVSAIAPNPRQPRQVFDEEELEELAASIREVGLLQPVVVRPNGTDEEGRARYELIMGERRWRASQHIGAETIPAIIRQTGAEDMLRDALLENLHRAQLNPLEEAAAYQQMLDDFDCTHEELAARIARSRPQISNTLRLLKLPPLVQRRVAAGVLSAGHARALLGMQDGAAMERMAQRIVAEGLSVRATEELITLGEDPAQPEMRRRPRAGAHSAALNDLGGRLSDKFDTKVKVSLGQRKGRINIEFASVQDLNRILELLSPSDPGLFKVPEDQHRHQGGEDQPEHGHQEGAGTNVTRSAP